MFRKITLYLFVCFFIGLAHTQNTATHLPVRVFYLGHSLTDYLPEMIDSLADPQSFDWAFQSIPGAPLRWQWQRMLADDFESYHPHSVAFYHPEYGLPSGKYTVLVLTESVPRHQGNSDESHDYMRRFLEYALSYNPDIQVYIYEVWHCIKSGTPTACAYDLDSSDWRQRLDDDLNMWESFVARLNEQVKPANPVCLIPAGQALAHLYDAIEAGQVPQLSKLEDIFEDDIHLNDLGRYFIATLHYGMLLRQNPVGLDYRVYSQWGELFDGPKNQVQAQILQSLALETLENYPQSCYTGH